MAETEHSDVFSRKVRHYAEILNDLFDVTRFMSSDRLFEFVCALVRTGGVQVPGWDSWYESQAVIDDLQNLATLELPPERFPDAERTRVRLALLSYCHVTEMDMPYVILANLLRLRLGQKYDIDPFTDLARPVGKKTGIFQEKRPPSPGQRIKRIMHLAEKAELPKIGEAVAEIYDNIIRNAVYHSDYVLHQRGMHLQKNYRFSKTRGHGTPVVDFDELGELITNAFAFYSALFALYERCRRSFTDFKNAIMPYDVHYKGLMELVFDVEDRLIGFRVYWPNGTLSQYSRTKDGCVGTNIVFNTDRSINFMVGLYASKPGTFSLLVEHDSEPSYPPRPGTEIRPYWPPRWQCTNYLENQLREKKVSCERAYIDGSMPC